MSVEVGNILEGKVVKILPFGAFIQTEDGTNGLVHISEVSKTYVNDINEYLKVGDKVKVKVIKIDESGKISMSIKKALDEPRTERTAKKTPKKRPRTQQDKNVRPMDIDWGRHQKDMSFEDMLGKFKQDSDETMQSLKRSNESKRSGGYKRSGR